MHELSLVDGIVKHVSRLRTQYGFHKVREIEIICGEHRSVNADNIEFFLGLEDDPWLHGARVGVVRLTKKYYCMDCDMEFDGNQTGSAACPHGGHAGSVVASRGVLNIRKLEVD